jgi:predicted O-methyltransferase YrrM
MYLFSRLARPWFETKGYEWAESCDLILDRWLGNNRMWLSPFEPPRRNDLIALDRCFEKKSAEEAIQLLSLYHSEVARLPPALSLNIFFGPADVAFYWSFIRARRPNTIIEVGSGYSSRVALRALEKNQQGRLICIDPAPRLRLPKENLTHIASRIEDADPNLFKDFQPHDILFIDSSHTGGEVQNHAVILDRLPVGSLVHYHDIDYPWDRQQPEWDEDSALDRFLSSRPNWKVIVSGSILSRDYLPQLNKIIPAYRRTPYRRYNALWVMRMA